MILAVGNEFLKCSERHHGTLALYMGEPEYGSTSDSFRNDFPVAHSRDEDRKQGARAGPAAAVHLVGNGPEYLMQCPTQSKRSLSRS